MSIKKQIPNIITLLNLFSGCIAVYFACVNQLTVAALFTALGIFFDFFDGFFARLFKANSELGLQLDSLADMVTSGVVPGVFMFQLMLQSSAVNDALPIEVVGWNAVEWVPFFGFLITLASCYRLANFNIDTRQTSSFIGLPTPANTLLVISIGLISIYQSSGVVEVMLDNIWVLMMITILSCYLLNSKMRLFALKFKNLNFKDNWVRYLLIVSSIVLLLLFKYIGITSVIILYIILSLIFKGKESE